MHPRMILTLAMKKKTISSHCAARAVIFSRSAEKHACTPLLWGAAEYFHSHAPAALHCDVKVTETNVLDF